MTHQQVTPLYAFVLYVVTSLRGLIYYCNDVYSSTPLQ